MVSKCVEKYGVGAEMKRNRVSGFEKIGLGIEMRGEKNALGVEGRRKGASGTWVGHLERACGSDVVFCL